MLSTPIFDGIDYDKVYEPSEDSFYLLDCFEDQQTYLLSKYGNRVPLVLEIGTGSGIVTTFMLQHILPQALYLASDINPSACITARNTIRQNCSERANFVDILRMDLASSLRTNIVDVLVFNPPYVPAEEMPIPPANDEEGELWLDLALLGGKDGMVTTWKVLNLLQEILASDGIAYILFCARNRPDEVAEIMRNRGWSVDVIINKKAGWEVLSILRFTKA